MNDVPLETLIIEQIKQDVNAAVDRRVNAMLFRPPFIVKIGKNVTDIEGALRRARNYVMHKSGREPDVELTYRQYQSLLMTHGVTMTQASVYGAGGNMGTIFGMNVTVK